MTNCEAFEHQLGAYMDHELDASATFAVEQHLRECERCRTAYERQVALGDALRGQLPRFEAPDLVRARIQGALRARHGTTPTRRWQWAAIAASVLFVISAGYGVLGSRRAASAPDAIAQDVLSSHVRSLMPNHLTDVASTDQHNVKPWFNGRVDYSPPVYDLASQGFPLVGGRLDYVANRTVAALVYQRRKHVINVFLWPTAGKAQRTPELDRQGYHLLHWTRGGLTYWVVSDLNVEELREFVRLEQQMDSIASRATPRSDTSTSR